MERHGILMIHRIIRAMLSQRIIVIAAIIIMMMMMTAGTVMIGMTGTAMIRIGIVTGNYSDNFKALRCKIPSLPDRPVRRVFLYN